MSGSEAGTGARARLLVVGGFLGAGKTTALLALAQRFHAAGRRVALITNDQADNLVDTASLRVRGLRVEEVAGACFCCRFDDLARAAELLAAEARPDVLLAEPVGSCTDLAATVIAPFRRLYADRFDVAPYSVLVDPVRARQLVLQRGFGGFSAKVAYIFLKQLEEADVICVSKADLLADAARAELLEALRAEFPGAAVLATSSLTGEGFDAWAARLGSGADAGTRIADVDYDTYAEGEAELGWLNMAARLSADTPFDADALVLALVRGLSDALAARGAEVAHLKLLLEADGRAAVANAVGGASGTRLSTASGLRPREARLVVNARVAIDPQVLRALADEVLAAELLRAGVRAELDASAQFRPGRPVPIHRDEPAPGSAMRAAPDRAPRPIR
jgi:G3E family GTPase